MSIYVILFLGGFLSITSQNNAASIRKDNHKKTSDRLNFFDIDLLRYASEDSNGNIMVSPASVKSTLAMLLEGAQGETAAQIRAALRLSPNVDEFREQLAYYISVLQANTTGVVLENANAVFVPLNAKVRKDFQLLLNYVYFSAIQSVDYMNPDNASKVINDWVNNKTRGLIPAIVESVNINPSTKMILANALYFKGAWQRAFNPLLTKPGCFYSKNKCIQVPTMELQTELNYAFVDNLRAHSVELPYEGGRYSMVILVPQDRNGSTSLIRDLPYMSLTQIVDLLEPVDVQLYLPKFSVDYSNDLVPVLRNIGIRDLFSAAANLSLIFQNKDSPQVNKVFHKTRMEVNEQGTVAAAATGAMVIPLMGGGVYVKVDRPFVFFIRDNVIGAVLFEGKIESPELLNSDTSTQELLKSPILPLSVNKSRGKQQGK